MDLTGFRMLLWSGIVQYTAHRSLRCSATGLIGSTVEDDLSVTDVMRTVLRDHIISMTINIKNERIILNYKKLSCLKKDSVKVRYIIA